MRLLRTITSLIAFGILLIMALTPTWSLAEEQDLRPIIEKFAMAKKFSQTEAVIDELGALGNPASVPALDALAAGRLKVRKSDGRIFITEKSGSVFVLKDPLSLEKVDEVSGRELGKVKIKNSLRRKISAVLSGLTLGADNPSVRLAAVETIFRTSDATQLEPLEAALSREADVEIRKRMEAARASAILSSKRDVTEKKDAVQLLGQIGGREALSILTGVVNSKDSELAALAAKEVETIESKLRLWEAGQNIWYGVSLGSVLLLAAIGLAITFGVMGVINMAHGEMVMIGAYTTFVVQEVIRSSAPELFDYSLAIALPLAFLAAGLVGLLIERGVIQFLYGRPLETLLATWGISLILQQTVRTVFGPTNREVGNPSWMSGAFEIGQMSVTWNRLWIVVFSLAVFAILLFVMNRTSIGLYMRAVTQNRRMASAMGIRTPWVDAMTFALGSGIAGIAGVALSQIDNVSPNLGQSYIIDSFMVVVFGGVGNLWGTLVGALSLGIVNKFLEPYAGAVLGKVLVLAIIILFIQKRPRGLFALKGRAVEQ